jgi:hypothetical protein
MKRMLSVNARNRLELIMIKSFARPGNETPKLASGARASMPELHQGLIRDILPLGILLASIQVEVIPPPQLEGIPTLIANLAIWIWIVNPGVLLVAVLMPMVHMVHQPGHTTAV